MIMGYFDEYKEFKQQCRKENIDSNEFVNYMIMKALIEITTPDKNRAELETKVDYLTKKLVANEHYTEQLRRDAKDAEHTAYLEGLDKGYQMYRKYIN